MRWVLGYRNSSELWGSIDAIKLSEKELAKRVSDRAELSGGRLLTRTVNGGLWRASIEHTEPSPRDTPTELSAAVGQTRLEALRKLERAFRSRPAFRRPVSFDR